VPTVASPVAQNMSTVRIVYTIISEVYVWQDTAVPWC